MSHPSAPATTTGATGEVPKAAVEQERALFSEALGRLLAAEPEYLRLGRLTESAPGYREPRALCRQLLASLRGERILGEPGARPRFLAWAERHKPRSRLLPVLAAEDDLRTIGPAVTHGKNEANSR